MTDGASDVLSLSRSGGRSLPVRQRPRQPSSPIAYAALASPADTAAAAEEEGYATGYETGYAEGRRRAAAEAEAAEQARSRQVDQALGALDRALESQSRAIERRQTELDQAVPGFAFELLEVLVQRELALATSPGRDAIERALATDDTTLPATARLHPSDVETLGSLEDLRSGRAVEVVADPSVEPGGALVEIGDATIDSQVSAALDRVRAVLVGTDAAPPATGTAGRSGPRRRKGGADQSALRKALGPLEQAELGAVPRRGPAGGSGGRP